MSYASARRREVNGEIDELCLVRSRCTRRWCCPTSPPYPNEKDYTRTTRLESVLLGFVSREDELRALKRVLIRSNTRGVYREDDDDQWVSGHSELQRPTFAS